MDGRQLTSLAPLMAIRFVYVPCSSAQDTCMHQGHQEKLQWQIGSQTSVWSPRPAQKKNTYLSMISGISMELWILQQVLQQQIQIMDLISVSIIHRKNGLHHDCWSQQAALASIYLQGHGRTTGVKGTSESITDHLSPYKLRHQYDHELHSRLFWLRDNRHHRTLQRPHWLWISTWLPVAAWMSDVNILTLAAGITDVINLIHVGLFTLTCFPKVAGILNNKVVSDSTDFGANHRVCCQVNFSDISIESENKSYYVHSHLQWQTWSLTALDLLVALVSYILHVQ